MISKFLAYNNKVSVVYADTTELVKYISNLQSLNELTKEIIGKFYTASVLMAISDLKEESDEIIVQLNGGGETGLLYSDVKIDSNNVFIKGFIENNKIDLEKNKNNPISNIIGKKGSIIVTKNNKYTKLGYKSIIPLVSGNIEDDFKSYYENSTQKPAFIGLEVFDNKSFGYIITFMPDAADKDISNINKNIKNNLTLKEIIMDNDFPDDIVKIITGDNKIKKIQDNINVTYKCDCTKEKYIDMLLTLNKSELEQLFKEDEKINIVCQYCNKSYDCYKSELEDIIMKQK